MREIKRKDLRKKTREAVALQYLPDEGAPRVVAAGKGYVAEKIIESAEANLVPVHEDPELAHMLNLLNIGAEIPPELYAVVAQILIFVKDVDSYLGTK
ncbi:EscU/YscU/HrcU family type III secretion system export apparatus switch protein [Oscillospiraceae bacterium OttesenSCG-928-G22]|nr:EscU/YscU/HrcU family type III secretion system export apparatus switch protein [Oscillospiraceae bacterium OttesenSCG-928-G22]